MGRTLNRSDTDSAVGRRGQVYYCGVAGSYGGHMMHIRYWFIVVYIALAGTAWAGATTEYSWEQLEQPFQQTIKIPLYGKAILNVNVPAEILKKNKKILIKMLLDTPFRKKSGSDDFGVDSLFAGFSPAIVVNGSRISGMYPIRLKYHDGENRSNAYVKIKSKHLHPGLNSLSFDAGKNRQFTFFCGNESSNCTALFVHEIWLEQ